MSFQDCTTRVQLDDPVKLNDKRTGKVLYMGELEFATGGEYKESASHHENPNVTQKKRSSVRRRDQRSTTLPKRKSSRTPKPKTTSQAEIKFDEERKRAEQAEMKLSRKTEELLIAQAQNVELETILESAEKANTALKKECEE